MDVVRKPVNVWLAPQEMMLNICKKLKLRSESAFRSQVDIIRKLKRTAFQGILFPVLIHDEEGESIVVSSLVEYVIDVDISIFGVTEQSRLIDSNCRKYSMTKSKHLEIGVPFGEYSELNKKEILSIVEELSFCGKKIDVSDKEASVRDIFGELYRAT